MSTNSEILMDLKKRLEAWPGEIVHEPNFWVKDGVRTLEGEKVGDLIDLVLEGAPYLEKVSSSELIAKFYGITSKQWEGWLEGFECSQNFFASPFSEELVFGYALHCWLVNTKEHDCYLWKPIDPTRCQWCGESSNESRSLQEYVVGDYWSFFA
jgi:hypothetical protein